MNAFKTGVFAHSDENGDVSLLVRDGTFDAEMAREIFEDRYYTTGGWDIPTLANVLDIGGGVGAFAVFAAVNGAGVVHTFEPIPDTYRLLRQNVDEWCYTGEIVPYPMALSTGFEPYVWMTGFEPMADGVINTGLPKVSSDGDIEVQAMDIHTALNLEERWHVVKIDIEGYEYELLESLADHEFEKIDMITMEFHHPDESTAEARGLGLGEFLKAKGFTEVEVSWAWGNQGRLRARK